jgi:hypothetical protein
VAEWSIAPVLKTGDGQPSVSSNLTASARLQVRSQMLVAADGKGLAFEQITGDKLQFAWRDLL